MKFKILLISLLGIIITSIIYFSIDKSKLSLLALGDGLSKGMTAYNVEGYDFNDYLVEYLNEQNNLEHYYRNFNETDETVTNLLNKIDNNISSLESNIKIKQAIKTADIITISLGMDELNNYALKNNLGSTKIKGYLNKIQELFAKVRSLNDKKIFVISLYSSKQINKDKILKINTELAKLCQKNKLVFIDISDIRKNSEYFTKPNNYYPNYKGQEYIFEKIKNNLNDIPTLKTF